MNEVSRSPGTVLIVGAGPAGLATAVALRLEGFVVTVLERRAPPLDKACGEGLMPEALEALGKLGVDLSDVGESFSGIRYCDECSTVQGRFPSLPGKGVRRLELSRRLLGRALALGVHLEWATPVDRLVDRPDGQEDIAFYELWTRGGLAARSADWIVLADGLRSPLRSQLQLAKSGRRRERFGVRRHFRLSLEQSAVWRSLPSSVEVWWAEGGEAYVTPLADSEEGVEVGVAVLFRKGAEGLPSPAQGSPPGSAAFVHQWLGAFPDSLSDRLRDAEPLSPVLGVGPLEQQVTQLTKGNVALVGDASGYLDAITGEGLAVAFGQALALAESLKSGSLVPYTQQVRRIRRLPTQSIKLVLQLSDRPGLRRAVLRALEEDPAQFDALLGVGGAPNGSGETMSVVRRGLPAILRVLWGAARQSRRDS